LNGIEKSKGMDRSANKDMKMRTKMMKLIARRPGLSRYRTKSNFLEKDNSSDAVDGVSQKRRQRAV
jgi:hypothetical protein